MVENIIQKLEQYSYKQLITFFVGLPIVARILEFSIKHLLNFGNIPIYDLSIFVLYAIFFVWIWNYSIIRNNQTVKLKDHIFKICFWVFLTFKTLELLILIDLEFLEFSLMRTDEFFSMHSIMRANEINLIIKGTYIYIIYFTAKVIKEILLFYKPENNHAPLIKYAIYVYIFPIGIPIIHNIFEESSLLKRFKNNNNQTSIQSSAQLHTEYKQIRRASYDKIKNRNKKK